MKSKLIEYPLLGAPRNTPMNSLGLHAGQSDSHGILRYLETDDTIHTAQQMRLMLSWSAVLSHSSSSELGAGRW